MNKILKLYKKEFAEDFLRKNVLSKLADYIDIRSVIIREHKTHIWENTYHVVIEYYTKVVKKDGKTKNISIFCVAHSQEPRKYVFDVLQYLWDNKYPNKFLSIPKPLFYSNYFKGTFYVGVAGNNLYHYIRTNDFDSIESMIPRAAAALSRLHSMPIDNFSKFNRSNTLIKTVVPGVNHIIERINYDYPEYHDIFQKAYDFFIHKEEKFFKNNKERWIIHGDAHPENIIKVRDRKIGVIDFSDTCIGDFTRDIGCIIQQIEFMIMRKIGKQKYADKMKKLFLDSYIREAKIELNDYILDRINNYYYWTSIRTATFFLIKDNPEPERSKPLLEKISNFIK